MRNILTATFAVAYLFGVSGVCGLANYTADHSSEHQLGAPEGRAVYSLNSIRILQKTTPSALSFTGGFCPGAGAPVLWSMSQFRLDEVNPEGITQSVAQSGRAPPLVRGLA